MSGLSRKLFGLLSNRNIILILALSLGLFWGQGVQWTEMLVIPALAFVMMLSTTSIKGKLFRSPGIWLKPAMTGLFLNYVILGGLIITLSNLLPLEEHYRTGYLILSAVPPAVGVIPFTSILNGDVEFSLIGCLTCYIGAFITIPLMFSTILGISFEFQSQLIITLVELILIPLLLSRFLLYSGLASRIEPVRGVLTNWSFFIVIYTVVGVNRDVFFSQPLSLLPAAILTIMTTYLLGYIIEKVGKMLRTNPQQVTSMLLLGTSKNAGFSAGLALTLFGKKTAIPITVQTVMMLSYIIFLDLQKSRKRDIN